MRPTKARFSNGAYGSSENCAGGAAGPHPSSLSLIVGIANDAMGWRDSDVL